MPDPTSTRLPARLPDGGPWYKETPADPAAFHAQLAEPYNTVTATLFVLIAVFWMGRLWGRFARYPFVTICLPVLLAGGVGGTLYHATRADRLYFLLDVIPIQILGAAGSVFLTFRLAARVGYLRVLAYSVGLVAVFVALNAVVIRAIPLPAGVPNLRVNMHYATLALVLLVPMGVVLVRTKFRYAGWVAGGLASFGIAWFCRLVDGGTRDVLPMGTHWLWHTFGAVTTFAIAQYFYLLEGDRDQTRV